LILAMTSMFFLHNPLATTIRLHTNGNSSLMIKSHLSWIIFYSTVAVACGSYLLLRGLTFLLLFLALFALLLAVHLLMQTRRQHHGKLSELIAIAGLTSSGLATRGVLIGELDQEGFLLWLLCFLFFSSSVFYVKMRVSRQMHNKDSTKLTSLCVAFHIVLVLVLVTLAIYKIIPMYTAAAYFPIVIRAFMGIGTSGKINLKRIGIGEVVYTIIFAGILIFTESSVL
ncbi:YwiC-like family protein, partial [bacterium]|nr:YwiC-like family protein [bacterium]